MGSDGALVIDLPKSQRLIALPIATGVNFRTEFSVVSGDDDPTIRRSNLFDRKEGKSVAMGLLSFTMRNRVLLNWRRDECFGWPFSRVTF